MPSASKPEVTNARISRGHLKSSCGKALEKAHAYLKDLEKAEPKDLTHFL